MLRITWQLALVSMDVLAQSRWWNVPRMERWAGKHTLLLHNPDFTVKMS